MGGLAHRGRSSYSRRDLILLLLEKRFLNSDNSAEEEGGSSVGGRKNVRNNVDCVARSLASLGTLQRAYSRE